MTTKPLSNSPAQMQKWSRWVDAQLDELGLEAIPAIKAQLASMDANDIRYQQLISDLEYQIKYFSETTANAVSFTALQTTLKATPVISLKSPTSVNAAGPGTLIFTASGSACWNQDSGALITGSGDYDDAGLLYQGTYNGLRYVSSFWFSNTDLNRLASRTITSASVYLKNRYAADPNYGSVVKLGTHAYQVPTMPTSRDNPFEDTFYSGEGSWIPLSATVYNGLKAKTITGFSIGVGSSFSYSTYDGFAKDYPPKIKITYSA